MAKKVNEFVMNSWVDLLAENPGMVFDRQMAESVCRLRGLPFRGEILPREPTMSDFIVTFSDDRTKTEFMEYYVRDWNDRVRQVIGKAKCGCVHHAEQGLPCSHDLALI